MHGLGTSYTAYLQAMENNLIKKEKLARQKRAVGS